MQFKYLFIASELEGSGVESITQGIYKNSLPSILAISYTSWVYA